MQRLQQLLQCFVDFHAAFHQASITREGEAANIGIIILNTLLGGCSGGLVVLLLCRRITRQTRAVQILPSTGFRRRARNLTHEITQ